MSSEKSLYFQDFLNYYGHVEVLRLFGRPWGKPHQAMAGYHTREGVREDRRPDLVYVRDTSLARTVRERAKGMAGID